MLRRNIGARAGITLAEAVAQFQQEKVASRQFSVVSTTAM
jgi:hypothetical protein